MAAPIEISLATLDNGGLMECVTNELHKICDNIADPNVKTDAKRKLTISLEIKPDAKGQMAAITYDLKTVMPGPEAGRTVAYIAKAAGSKHISFFEVESQPPLFEDEEPQAPIARFAPAREA